MPKILEIANLLDNMPKKADNIADLLRMKQIRGKIGNPYQCPIKNYIEHVTGCECFVCLSSIVFYDKTASRIPVPSHIVQFMIAFDSGLYPDLILLEKGTWPKLECA